MPAAKSEDNNDVDYDAKTHRVCHRVSIKLINSVFILRYTHSFVNSHQFA